MPEHDEEKTGRPMSPIEEKHPHIVEWVQSYGWIEIGWDDNTRSFLKAIDPGGGVWQSDPGKAYATLDEALQDLEAALEERMDDLGL